MWRTLAAWVSRRRMDREIDEELQFHVAMKARESGDLASARRAVGNRLLLREQARDAWRWRWLDDLAQDLRYGARGLRRNPGFAAAAIFTIALGLGAAAAIFSVTDSVLLRPLPYRDAQRLVLIEASSPTARAAEVPLSYDLFDRLRRGTRDSFEDMAALFVPRAIVPRGDGSPELIYRGFATTNFLDMMGARVMLGRGFQADDGRPQRFDPNLGVPAGSVAILTYEYWQSRYGGNPAAIGQEMPGYRERGPRIVGVLAPGFRLYFRGGGPDIVDPQVWIAYNLEYPPDSQSFIPVSLVGKLKDGAGVAQAREQLDRLAPKGLEFRVTPILAKLVAQIRPAILSLLGAVLFLLLIACSNVANLLLSRAALRERELAVRAALGGGWARLLRQMLTEAVLLALCGSAVGIALAWGGLRGLMAIAPADLPRVASAGIDGRVLMFAVAAAFFAALIFGMVPALRSARTDVIGVFRGRAGLGGSGFLRNGVVIAEVALSFVLRTGSGLMVRSFVELHRIDPGFDGGGVLTAVVLRDWNAAEPALKREALLMAVRDRLRKIPGVEAVGAALALPLTGSAWNPGTSWFEANGTFGGHAEAQWVVPGYFAALRMRVIAGRVFGDADNAPGRRLVVIDDALARKAFANRPAVGGTIRLFNGPAEVIGVVGHTRQVSLAESGPEQFYLADGASGFGVSRQWAIRTSGDPMLMAAAVREALQEVDPLLLAREVEPMSAVVDRARSATWFALLLISVFAGVAAMLAAIGLYGVLATVVRQRTGEIGIRMALGARPRAILAAVIGDGLKLSAAGIAIGVAAALGITRAMASLLVGVTAHDPRTYLGAAAIFLAVSAAACSIPARRAARVDPMTALREE